MSADNHVHAPSRFQSVFEDIFHIPSSWFDTRNGSVSDGSYEALIFSTFDDTFTDFYVKAIANGLMRGQYGRSFRPNQRVVMRRSDAVNAAVEKDGDAPVLFDTYVLGMAYSVHDVLRLSQAQIRAALLLAARKPGGVSWETLMELLTQGVDGEMTEALLS